MTGKEYQEAAMRTRNTANDRRDGIIEAALGLAGEAGEVADMVKKSMFQDGRALTYEHLCKEIGDILWYCALMCDRIGTDLDAVMHMNVEKLKARYNGGGFDPELSKHRKEGDV